VRPLYFFLGAENIRVLLESGQDSLVQSKNRRAFLRPL